MTAAFGERWATRAHSSALGDRHPRRLPPVPIVTARAALRPAVAGLATYDVTCEEPPMGGADGRSASRPYE